MRNINRALLGDLDNILIIENECFSTPWHRENFVYELGNPLAEFYVYKKGGVAVGYLSFWTLDDEIHIGNIAVLKEHRGKGIGKALLKFLLNLSKKRKIGKITLEVRAQNTVAINLYKSMGFVEEGIRKGYYDDGEDAIIMWRYERGVKPDRRQNIL